MVLGGSHSGACSGFSGRVRFPAGISHLRVVAIVGFVLVFLLRKVAWIVPLCDWPVVLAWVVFLVVVGLLGFALTFAVDLRVLGLLVLRKKRFEQTPPLNLLRRRSSRSTGVGRLILGKRNISIASARSGRRHSVVEFTASTHVSTPPHWYRLVLGRHQFQFLKTHRNTKPHRVLVSRILSERVHVVPNRVLEIPVRSTQK